jgi:acyl carrier protein
MKEMEELINVLKGIKPEVDFENEKSLIGDELLDSFDIISIVSAIDEEFDVKITAKDIIPDNFNSAEALYDLIQRLEEE